MLCTYELEKLKGFQSVEYYAASFHMPSKCIGFGLSILNGINEYPSEKKKRREEQKSSNEIYNVAENNLDKLNSG